MFTVMGLEPCHIAVTVAHDGYITALIDEDNILGGYEGADIVGRPLTNFFIGLDWNPATGVAPRSSSSQDRENSSFFSKLIRRESRTRCGCRPGANEDRIVCGLARSGKHIALGLIANVWLGAEGDSKTSIEEAKASEWCIIFQDATDFERVRQRQPRSRDQATILQISREGKITFVSRRRSGLACDDVEASDLIGQPIMRYVDDADMVMFCRRMSQLLSCGVAHFTVNFRADSPVIEKRHEEEEEDGKEVEERRRIGYGCDQRECKGRGEDGDESAIRNIPAPVATAASSAEGATIFIPSAAERHAASMATLAPAHECVVDIPGMITTPSLAAAHQHTPVPTPPSSPTLQRVRDSLARTPTPTKTPALPVAATPSPWRRRGSVILPGSACGSPQQGEAQKTAAECPARDSTLLRHLSSRDPRGPLRHGDGQHTVPVDVWGQVLGSTDSISLVLVPNWASLYPPRAEGEAAACQLGASQPIGVPAGDGALSNQMPRWGYVEMLDVVLSRLQGVVTRVMATRDGAQALWALPHELVTAATRTGTLLLGNRTDKLVAKARDLVGTVWGGPNVAPTIVHMGS